MNLNYKNKKFSALRFNIFCAKINDIIIRLIRKYWHVILKVIQTIRNTTMYMDMILK